MRHGTVFRLCRASLKVFVGAAAVVLAFVGQMYFQFGSQIAPGMGKDSLLKLRPGMSKQEVVALVGRPLGMSERAVGQELTYARPSPWWFGGISIRLQFADEKLDTLSVKDYGLLAYYCTRARAGCETVWDFGILNRLSIMKSLSAALDRMWPGRGRVQ